MSKRKRQKKSQGKTPHKASSAMRPPPENPPRPLQSPPAPVAYTAPELNAPLPPSPPRRHRLLSHFVVWVFLGLQLGLPISYYVGDDIYDERFAWRMFSPIRMVKCEVRMEEGVAGERRPLSLRSRLPMPWVNWMKRGHHRVVNAFGDHHCALRKTEGAPVSLYAEVRCHHPDGRVDILFDGKEDLCATP